MGGSILVAPLVQGEESRKIYLPKGNWYSFWTNEKYTGGEEIEISVPLEMIPVAKPVEFITKDTCFDITINGYGENLQTLELYEDDGLSFNFEKGEYNIIKIKYENSNISVEKNGNFSGNKYNIDRFNHIK